MDKKVVLRRTGVIARLLRDVRGVAAVILALLAAPAWAGGGYVHDVSGDVSIAYGKNGPQAVSSGFEIGSDTQIVTGDMGHAVLKFEDGQVVAIQANTVLNVNEYLYNKEKVEKSNIIFSSLKGGLLFITGLVGQRSKKSFRLTTPNATIGVRGTEFMIVMVDGALYGKVLSGSISMGNSAGKAIFDAGETVLVSSSNIKPQAIPAEKVPPGIFDQLATIQLPSAEAASLPVQAMTGAANIPAADVVIGSALVGAAAAIAGGAATTQAAPVGVMQAEMPPVLPVAEADGEKAAVLPVAADPESPVVAGAVAVPVNASPRSVRRALAWYDDTIPPKNVLPAGSQASIAEGGQASVGDPSLFGRHNFTPDGAGTGEICVFCHTPQGVENQVAVPLWNRTQSGLSEYRAYSSIGSATAEATGSISMACLSCHDGTQAPNVVINKPVTDSSFDPEVERTTREYLKNHHPVSMLYGGGGVSHKQPDAPVDVLNNFLKVDYDSMAVRKLTSSENAKERVPLFKDVPSNESNEGLFVKPNFNLAEHSGSGSGTVWWLETRGTGKGRQKADFYLYTRTETVDGEAVNRPYVECATCHDPHSTNTTFLRISNSSSAVCMTCHAK